MSKYRNVKSGIYASRKEAARAAELRLMEKAGIISDLREQVKYILVPKQIGERAVTYTCDFQYRENGQLCVEDSKGMKTQQYVIRRKLMKWVHGITVRET